MGHTDMNQIIDRVTYFEEKCHKSKEVKKLSSKQRRDLKVEVIATSPRRATFYGKWQGTCTIQVELLHPPTLANIVSLKTKNNNLVFFIDLTFLISSW